MSLYNSDTICALGTRNGDSAIGIVRLSGSNSIRISDKIFMSSSGRKIKEMLSYTMAHGYIIDESKDIIDEVIVSVMKSPKTYTREDVIEINCHGGITATNKVLSLCLKNGARMSDPGEFTKRAFLNGRIDLTQAEAVIEIISARTEQSLKIAAKNIKGDIKNKLEELRKELLGVLIELEAAIDFIEEDLEITPYADLEKKVNIIYKEISYLIMDEKKGELVKNGIKVAIIGKPNVGKSSLLNAISKKEKAIVTHIPGTTRDAIEDIIYLDGIPIIFIDTAGIRKAKNLIEKIGVKNSLKFVDDAEILLVVVDASAQLDKYDEEILKIVNLRKSIICFNKTDIGNLIVKKDFTEKYGENTIVAISAKDGSGINNLENKINEKIHIENDFNLNNKIIINLRHKKILLEVQNCLREAVNAMKKNLSEEFPSADLKHAYDLLGEILGTNTQDDIINGIFSKFCIGK